MFNIGPLELIVVLVLALIVLGPQKFPEAGRAVGKAMREFRSVTDGLTRELTLSLDEPSHSRRAPVTEEEPPVAVTEVLPQVDTPETLAAERPRPAPGIVALGSQSAAADDGSLREDTSAVQPAQPEENQPGPV